MALSEKGRTLLYLFLLWLIYLIVGVFIFRAVEHDGDKEPDKSEEAQLEKVKGNIMAKYNISESEFNDIVQQIQTASSSNAGPEWNYHEAVSFVIQLVTTIGYGNITPVTTGGRVLCIFYAFFGIPINILFLQLVGERMLQVEQHLVTRFEATFLNKEGVPKFLNEKCSLLGFVLLVILLLISARTQKAIDDWTFFEGFYAYFITYTTVGFGDLIPGDKVRSPGHTTVRVIFIILGLAAMSNVINALVKCTECLRWLTRLTARCGRNKSADRPGETEGNGELELKAVRINHGSEI